MKHLRYNIVITAITLSLLLLTSCEKKELCYDHTHMVEMNVEFVWDSSRNASPHTMVAHFFRMDGSPYLRFEFTNPKGGKVRVEEGEYKILFHNGEMETVDEKEGNYDDFYVECISQSLLAPMGRADDNAPRPEHARQQAISSTPNALWGGYHEYLDINRGNKGLTLQLHPVEVTKNYTITIHDVENIADDATYSAALTGMSYQFNLSKMAHCGEAATLPLGIERVDEHTLRASFKAFGHCPNGEVNHTFTFYTSRQAYFNFDITDSMHKSSDPNNITVDIYGLKLPNEGSSMSPSIDGWDEIIEENIKME